jgi:ribosomal protein L20A (L18A)
MKADYNTPASIMRTLGFDPLSHMDPMQFCVAMFNDRTDLIIKNERKRKIVDGNGGIAMGLRAKCAIAALKHFYKELGANEEKTELESFGQQLVQATERVRHRRIIIEEIERISPKEPLPPASYPAAFSPEKNSPSNQHNSARYGPELPIKELNPEGDTDYDPDRDL